MFFDLATLWEQLVGLYIMGGFVMPPLLITTVLLWYGISYRMAMIKVSKDNPRRLIEKQLANPKKEPKTILEEAVRVGIEVSEQYPGTIRKNLDVLYWNYRTDIKKHRRLVTVLLIIAPLLGLLGTVSGMIETFDSLQSMTFVSQNGGIAGGISQALITTQFGLTISIPGLIIHSFINRRQLVIEQELEQLIDIFSSKPDFLSKEN